MRQPLLLPAFALMAGIVFADGSAATAPFWFWLTVAGLAAGWLVRSRAKLFICLAAFGLGGLTYAITQLPLAPDDLRAQAGGEPQKAKLRGHLIEAPSVQLIERRGALAEYMTVRLQLAEWQPYRGGPWIPASGLVLIGSSGVPKGSYYRGQNVEVSGSLHWPAAAAAPGLFDYRAYLRRQGIAFQLTCEAPRDWALGPNATTKVPVSDRFLAWAQEKLKAGLPNDEATGLIQAMTLGWRTGLTGDVQAVFMQSGTLHVFAISGLHIALIAATLVQVLRLIRLPRAVCGLLSVPLIWGYVGATGWQPSAIRSAAMTTMVVGTWALNRPGDLVNSLAAAAIALLVWDPGQLFQAGFQLSFGVVLTIAWFGSPIAERMKHWITIKRDPLLPAGLEPRWHKWVNVPLEWLGLALATGVAATIGSLPLTIQWFHMIGPVSLAANLGVVPLSEWVLLTNAITLMVGPAWPWLGHTANAAAWAGMKGMLWMSRVAAAAPRGWWYTTSPHWLWWIPYLALLFAAANGAFLTSRRKYIWLSASGIWLVLLTAAWLPARRTARLTIFAGSSAMHWSARGSEALIDAPPASGLKRIVAPFLHSRGRSAIANWVITHPDGAHLGDGSVVLDDLKISRVLLPAVGARSPAFRSLIKAAQTNRIAMETLNRGDSIQGWTVLHPDPDNDSAKAADRVLVLKQEHPSVLACGDLSLEGQRSLLAAERDRLPADILIISLPAGQNAISRELVEAVRPKWVIVHGAQRAHQPKGLRTLRQEMRSLGIPVWFLDQNTAVTIEGMPDGRTVIESGERRVEWGQ